MKYIKKYSSVTDAVNDKNIKSPFFCTINADNEQIHLRLKADEDDLPLMIDVNTTSGKPEINEVCDSITYIATQKLGESTNYRTENAITTNRFYYNSTLVSIKSHTFEDGVGTITFNKPINKIDSAFYNCPRALLVIVPKGIKTITSSAFYKVFNVLYYGKKGNDTWNATTRNGYLDLDSNILYNDTTRTTVLKAFSTINTSLTLPNTVKTIGNGAFMGCTSLTSITLPSGLTSIGSDAFEGCTNLASINIPNSVTSIGYDAFAGCSSLTSISIPNSVTSIGFCAFQNCSSLATISISNNISQLEYGVFHGCTSLPVIDNIRYADTYAVEAISKTETSYTIKSDTKYISNSCFSACSNMESIYIPASIIKIGNNVFNLCNELISIVVDENNSVYDSRNNCNAIIKTANNELIIGCQNTTIPDSVTSIGDYAFYYCNNLTSPDIPEGITNIGYQAFYYCNNLASLSLPQSLRTIGGYAFYSIKMNELIVPHGVRKIGNYAFSGITNIIYNGKATGSSWGAKLINAYYEDGVYYNNKNKTEIILIDSEITGEFEIPETITIIGDGAFRGSNITSITIPNSVTTIGYNVFANSAVEEVILPSNLEVIPSGMFLNCTNLTSITIPNSVTTIENNSFENTGIEELTLPKSVVLIESSMLGLWTDSYDGSLLTIKVELNDGTYRTFVYGGGEEWTITLANGDTATLEVWYVQCIIEGSLVTLSDHTQKPIEDITYDDELLTWDFENGCYSSAKPIFISKTLSTYKYAEHIFSDGNVLNTVYGEDGHTHRIFNYTDQKLEYASECIGKEIFTENDIVTLLKINEIVKNVHFYNIMTENHINIFVNGVLTTSRLNCIHPINNMMFDTTEPTDIKPYEEFEQYGISEEWYNKLHLGEQVYEFDDIIKYVNNMKKIIKEK